MSLLLGCRVHLLIPSVVRVVCLPHAAGLPLPPIHSDGFEISIILVHLLLRCLLLVILSMVVILGLNRFWLCLLITCLLRRYCL
jgi:hypothetical protein